MAIDALPVEIVRLVVTSIEEYTQSKSSLASLARTCKYLHLICQPVLYEGMCLNAVPHKLLPAAYTLFTCPRLAREVRSIEFAAHAVAPALPHRRPATPPGRADRRGWPDVPELDATLRKQVAAALEGEDAALIEECYTAVRDGTREDLVVMLVLMNLENLELAVLGAMGPGKGNADTRLIFRRAAPRLKNLTTVVFGKYPRPPESREASIPRPDLDVSYSLFADLFRLPAITKLHIYSMAPFRSWEVPQISEQSCPFFDFVYDIDYDNTTLEKLYLSEDAACSHAHLDHIVKHCPAVNFIDFYSPSITRSGGGSWGDKWQVSTFQKALECRADTLETLGLPDCLHPNSGSFIDQRASINLQGLSKLDFLWIHVSWIFSGEDLGMEAAPYDLERNAQRLVSMLPQSIRELCLRLEGDGAKSDESMSRAIEALVQCRCQNEFPNLELLDIADLTLKRMKPYIECFDLAKDNGLPVYLRDRQQWW